MDKTGFIVENIVLAHRFYAPPHWEFPDYLRPRPRHGLIYVLEGGARYEMGDGHTLYAEKDDLLYMPRNSVYLTRCGEEPFHHMTINFILDGTLPLPEIRRCEASERTRQEMTRIVNEWTRRQPYYRERSLGLLYLFLCGQIEIIRRDAAGAAEKLQEAITVLNSDSEETVSVAALAEICGMSETYFRRLFSQVFGMSPQSYKTHKRISYACDLLDNTNLSIEAVSFESGYRDPAYFCRIFKKTVGCSPSSYRRRNEDTER